MVVVAVMVLTPVELAEVMLVVVDVVAMPTRGAWGIVVSVDTQVLRSTRCSSSNEYSLVAVVVVDIKTIIKALLVQPVVES
jgi:hypothetical protein